jgi:hypothetical protein
MESGRTESVSAMGLTAGAHAKAVAARISEKNTDLSELVIQIALRRPAAVGNPSARVILGPAGFGMSTLLCTLAGRFVEDRAGSGFHAIRGRFSVGRRHSLCGRHVSELALSSLLGVWRITSWWVVGLHSNPWGAMKWTYRRQTGSFLSNS